MSLVGETIQWRPCQHVLMENLIYGHEGVKVIYDLKGSRRNRYQNEKVYLCVQMLMC